MPGQHKHPPLSLRLPEAERSWVLERHAATGQPVNAIIADAVAEYRARHADLSGSEVTHLDGDPSNLAIRPASPSVPS